MGYNYTCKKIDIYVDGIYKHSTDQSKTCKEAKSRYIAQFRLNENRVKCTFSRG